MNIVKESVTVRVLLYHNQILRIKKKLRGSYLSAEFLSEKKARNQIKCHFYNKANESEILKETDRFSRRDRIE